MYFLLHHHDGLFVNIYFILSEYYANTMNIDVAAELKNVGEKKKYDEVNNPKVPG